jgi:hypothetical protein
MKTTICLLLMPAALSNAAVIAFHETDGFEVTVTLDEDTGFYGYKYLIPDDSVTKFEISYQTIYLEPYIFDVNEGTISHWLQNPSGLKFFFLYDQDNGSVFFQSTSGPDWFDASYALPCRPNVQLSVLAPSAVPEPGGAFLAALCGLFALFKRTRR